MINEEMEGEVINFLVLPLLCPSVLSVGCLGQAVKHLARGGSKSCKGLPAELPHGLVGIAPAV